ncbi:MAG: Cobyrinic acid ac-diamide synthase [Dehalococcoidia bacterium]|nr:Cobyrinic acid ac-diamide synthase [Dehalococcoidia bacterium]
MSNAQPQVISLFNHKGGVSKTTTTFNLGWMLASKGNRVILVDADPQCNLTGMVLDYRGPTALEEFYTTEKDRNIMAGLAPAFESRPKALEGIDCVPIGGQQGLYLLPGHIRLAEYEVTLGIAHDLSASIQTLKNLPGAPAYFLRKTAEKKEARYVLVDMSPSLSSINQNLLMTSNFFIIPTSPDYFSVMAINSLAAVLPRWHRWAAKAGTLPLFRDADYPFPQTTPKLLGTIIQKYRPRGGGPAVAFQKWIDDINRTVSANLLPILTQEEMMLRDKTYRDAGISDNLCLSTISDFNSLIALSQSKQTPIFDLGNYPLTSSKYYGISLGNYPPMSSATFRVQMGIRPCGSCVFGSLIGMPMSAE